MKDLLYKETTILYDFIFSILNNNVGYTDAVKIENQEKKGSAVRVDLKTEEEYSELTICVRFMFTMFLMEEYVHNKASDEALISLALFPKFPKATWPAQCPLAIHFDLTKFESLIKIGLVLKKCDFPMIFV